MKPLVVFAHGKESGPWGSKIRHLASIAESRGCEVLSPDYGDLADPDARVRRLLDTALPAHDRLVLVGSSMGGYVSLVASGRMKPDGLFLMAPALYMPGYAEQNPVSGARRTCVVFGWRDDVIPVANAIRYAQREHVALHLIDGDHRLNDVLDDVGAIFASFLASIDI